MKVLLDTSVLVAALVDSHTHHERALPWLESVRHQQTEAVISAHTLAELYSVLSTLPVRPRISPADAYQLIADNVIGVMEVMALTVDDYYDLLAQITQQNIAGGAVYDGVIACAAAKAQVDHIVTFNARDFRRVRPALAASIIVP